MTPFERILSVMTKPVVVVLYLSLVLLSFFYMDRSLALYFHTLDLSYYLKFLNWITRLGLTVIYLPTFLILALIYRYYHIKPIWEARAWFLLLSVIVPTFVCTVLKVLLGRARPELLFNEHLYGFFGFQTKVAFWSFPSGHSTTIFSAAFGLSIIFPRYCYAFLVTAATVAASRILLTHHYLSDVLAAVYFSLIEIGLLLYILKPNLRLVGDKGYNL